MLQYLLNMNAFIERRFLGFIILSFLLSSCSSKSNSDTINTNNEILDNSQQDIKNELIGETFYSYTLSKIYNEFDDVSIGIFDSYGGMKIRISENKAVMADSRSKYYFKIKFEGDLIYLTDIDGFYNVNKGKIKCYKLERNESGITLIDTDISVLKSTNRMGVLGRDVGYIFSTIEHLKFKQNMINYE